MAKQKTEKEHDLFSIMELLKDHKVSSKCEPLKQVQYSAVQMFAAANFANTQILSKHFDEFDDLKKTVYKLNESLNAQTMQNETYQKKIKALEDQMKSSSNQQQQQQNKQSKINIIQITDQIFALQNVLGVHGKKISELIKRYKKDHGELSILKKKMNETSAKLIKESKSESISSSERESCTNSMNEQLETMKQSLAELELRTSEGLDEMKSDLAGHEMEHEGIINEIINQMDQMKNGFEAKMNEINDCDSMNDKVIQQILIENAANIHQEMEEMVEKKLKKMEKLMMNMTEKNSRKKSKISKESVPTITDLSRSPKGNGSNTSTTTSHHHHRTIISVDLANVNSHQMKHHNGGYKQQQQQQQQQQSDDVKIISTPNKEKKHNKHYRKKRLRSSSFDGKLMEQYKQRSTANSVLRPNTRGERT